LRYLVLLILSFNIVCAHPHTFIDVYSTIKSKDNKIEKITFKWYFDEMTSSLLIMDFDQNMDGKFDKAEIDYINESYFKTLDAFNFYTDIKVNKKTIFTKPTNFSSFIDNGTRIVYQFDVVLHTPKKDLSIEIYDEERFCALILKKKFIKSDTKYILSDIDNDLYFGYRLEFN